MNMFRTILCFIALFFFGNVATNAHSGIFESYAVLDNGLGNIYYDLQASTANNDYELKRLRGFEYGLVGSTKKQQGTAKKVNSINN